MNSEEIDNVNQGSYIEIGGDSSEESDDDTVHQNVHYLRTVSHPDELIFLHEVAVFSQHPLDYFSQVNATNNDCLN
jgi:hypothetical protein